MASMSWKDKYKSATETKAHFRHNEKNERMKVKHPKNLHINPTKTHFNFSVCNRSYDERCRIYDEAVANAEQMSHTETYIVKKGKNAGKTMTRTKTGLKKDAVTCLGLETAAPADLPLSQCAKWAERVHELECEMFGAENVIDTDGHFDEIHLYKDPVKNAYVWSRFHIHSDVLPRRADGSFCSRSIATRENIIKLNDMIEEMTQMEFGVQYNTGEEPRRKTVEALKADSAAAELDDISQDLTKVKAEVEVKKNEYDTLERTMKIRVQDIEQREKASADHEKELDNRENGLDDREIALVVLKAKIIEEAEEDAERIKAEANEEAEKTKAEAEKKAERIISDAEGKAKEITVKAIQDRKEAESIKKRLEARETANKRADAAETLNAPAVPNARPTRFDRAAAGDFSRKY